MTDRSKPNIFDFATSELSQDAFVCWLLSWAEQQYSETDEALHQTGADLLAKLFAAACSLCPGHLESLAIKRQYKGIDVLLLVNNTHALIIEDKTYTQQHSGQLARYRDLVQADFTDREIAAVYLKTGDQGCYDAVKAANYGCFLRRDLLDVLEAGETRGIRSEIFRDFLDHLRRIDTRVAAYADRPLSDWDDACWTGFFLKLQSRLGEGKWSYVPNASGGFMGFWWHFHGNKYLQLKQEQICFKIKVEDKAQQSARWEEWYRVVAAEAAERSVPILRPRRRNGTWMTVAVLDGDYRQQQNGKLDLSATIQVLRSAEVLLESAVARFSALV